MGPAPRRPDSTGDDALVAQLDAEQLRGIVLAAAARHDDVARALRLAASRAGGDLAPLRAEIDRALRTGRFLGYRESSGWAIQAAPIVAEIGDLAASSPSAELVALIERAVGHVVKVMGHADDSDGAIGDLARDLLDAHAQACDAGVADPVKLARWMIRFRFDDQDFFEVDPVRYAPALGELGLAAYRRDVGVRRQGGDDSFAATYAQKRLAVVAGDVEGIIRLLGGDLTAPYQFIRVAEAMAELGRDDDVLGWAKRGIAETSGWQVAQLYDLAAGVYARRGAQRELLDLRRDQHRHMPSSNTYALVRKEAQAAGVWDEERDAARSALAGGDLGGLVDVLLADEEPEAAWQVTVDNPGWDPGQHRWLRLAEAREPAHPSEALAIYLRLADVELETTGRTAYQRAAAILARARRAALAADCRAAFGHHITELRDRHSRRPTLIKILDKAALR
jgi:hypothetical protein